MVSAVAMLNKNKKPSGKPKPRELRRAELLVLESQKTVLEQRIEQLEKVGEVNLVGRKLKRDPTGLALPDRSKGNKRPKHETPMKLEDMFNQCRKLLNQLKRNRNAGPFSVPVDPVALNCPDYFTIVKHPMDFKTIGMKLRAKKRQYRTPLDFRDDVRLVFRNCTLYNPEGNQIRVMGDRLSVSFEELWERSKLEKLFQERKRLLSRERNGIEVGSEDELDAGGGGGADGKKKKSRKTKNRPIEYSLKRLKEVDSKMVELTSTVLNNLSAETSIEISKPMGFWQKRKLSQQLDSSPVDLLKKLEPIFQDLGDGEVAFDELEDEVCWKIKALIDVDNSQPPHSLEENIVETETTVQDTQPKTEELKPELVESQDTEKQDILHQQPIKDKLEVPDDIVQDDMELKEEREENVEQHGNGCCSDEMTKDAQSNRKDDLMTQAPGTLL